MWVGGACCGKGRDIHWMAALVIRANILTHVLTQYFLKVEFYFNPTMKYINC